MFPVFDMSKLTVHPLAERVHDLDLSVILPLTRASKSFEEINQTAEQIIKAKQKGASVILMIGAHVLRSGVQRFIIDLMEKGYLSCIATNGACIIHDYELARIGRTTESVARYIRDGKFGLWKEVGEINTIVSQAMKKHEGLGESIGKAVLDQNFPHKNISIFAAGYRLKIPVTSHVGIGYDITFQHPNCNGAAWGMTSYLDFLRFTRVLESMEGGVVMNFGSAVMGPEVYLKALSMVRNVAEQEKRKIADFVSLVCDLRRLPEHYHKEAGANTPGYYFRPWKTMLIRTTADGGRSYYVNADHKETVPALWTGIQDLEKSGPPAGMG